MNDHTITAIVSVLIAIVGLATISVLVSQSAQTSNVVNAGGNAFSRALCTALSPVTSGGGLLSGITGGACGGSSNPIGTAASTITYN